MKKFSFIIVLLLLVIGGISAWWLNGTAAVDQANTSYSTFTIAKGEGVRQVANNLKSQGIIKDSVLFFLLIKQLGLENKIQAGDFRLSPSMNASEIASALQVAKNDVSITIPEGKRAEEIADILAQKFPNYADSWEKALRAKEGYLFPDTYSFPKEASIDLIINTLTDTFEAKYQTLSGNRMSTLTKKEIVTIASLVEREAKHDQDRPMVASVILNRYDQGMKLDIDATIQYALGFDKQSNRWWKPELTFDDLEINSPYNTYKTTQLPPTPIANPGIKALEAVVNPADTDYLFYITDKQGQNHYAKTNDEHEANKTKYGL